MITYSPGCPLASSKWISISGLFSSPVIDAPFWRGSSTPSPVDTPESIGSRGRFACSVRSISSSALPRGVACEGLGVGSRCAPGVSRVSAACGITKPTEPSVTGIGATAFGDAAGGAPLNEGSFRKPPDGGTGIPGALELAGGTEGATAGSIPSPRRADRLSLAGGAERGWTRSTSGIGVSFVT
jgi:hypothetical protein